MAGRGVEYSAAASLYHLLTNCYPHDLPKGVEKQLALIVNGSVVPVLDRRPDLPPELAAVIHRALLRDPKDRFRTVTSFRKALLPFAGPRK